MEALVKTLVDMVQGMVDDEVTENSVIKAGDEAQVAKDEGKLGEHDIVLDSLDAIDLLFEIEGKLGVDIEAERLADILPTSIAELAVYVAAQPKKEKAVVYVDDSDQILAEQSAGSDPPNG